MLDPDTPDDIKPENQCVRRFAIFTDDSDHESFGNIRTPNKDGTKNLFGSFDPKMNPEASNEHNTLNLFGFSEQNMTPKNEGTKKLFDSFGHKSGENSLNLTPEKSYTTNRKPGLNFDDLDLSIESHGGNTADFLTEKTLVDFHQIQESIQLRVII